MPEEYWANALFSMLPSLAVGLIFLLVIRGILGADRNERKMYDTVMREERDRMAAQGASAPVTVTEESPSRSTPASDQAAGEAAR